MPTKQLANISSMPCISEQLAGPEAVMHSQRELRISYPGVCLDTANFVRREALAAGSVGELSAASASRLAVLEFQDRLRGSVIKSSS
jgi:hypothetical protein